TFRPSNPNRPYIFFGNMEGVIRSLEDTQVKVSTPKYPRPETVAVTLFHADQELDCGTFTFQDPKEYEKIATSIQHRGKKRPAVTQLDMKNLRKKTQVVPEEDVDPIEFNAHNGNVKELKGDIQEDRTKIALRNYGNFTPLHFAMEKNQQEIAEVLLKEGADV